LNKKQLSDYSHYLVNEIATTQKKLKAISKGDMSPKKLDELLAYYEELNSSNTVGKYLDYLAEKFK
jgi:hypothetical protein